MSVIAARRRPGKTGTTRRREETSMAEWPFTLDDLQTLAQWDTPTICNGLELVAPERRAIGFTVEPVVAADRRLPPIVGLARTGLIRAREPPRGAIPPREAWYEYVEDAGLPTIAVIQDIDERPGYGAFWGEVQSTVHQALGVLGCVTNGSFRDCGMLAPGFQILGGSIGPSHAHVHMLQFNCQVNVFGLPVGPDDIIHADAHGAVVIPAVAVTGLPAAIELVSRREKLILDMARSPGFTAAGMATALRLAGEIH
jgi:regulator of RNase E activity RraA